jgi:AraC family transcriptional regulator
MSAPRPAHSQIGRHYRTVRRGSGLRLLRCQCHAGVHDRPTDEEHQAFSVTLVERGTFSYRTRAGHALLSPGWLMLGNDGAGYVCSHEQSDGTGDDCTVLSLSPETINSASSALGAHLSGAAFQRACLPPSPRVTALFGTLLAAGEDGFALEETTLAVIANVWRSLHEGAAPAPRPRQDERAQAAAHYIERNATEPVSLDDVAQAIGVSSFHLLRIFRRAIGVTPHQYLMRVRLLRAMALLRDTGKSITVVAYEAGWSDLSNFTRTFGRDVGCSPGEFRRGNKTMVSPSRSVVDRPKETTGQSLKGFLSS